MPPSAGSPQGLAQISGLMRVSSSEVLSWLGKHAFFDRYASDTYPEEDASGNVVWKSKAKFWFGNRLTHHYHEVIFDPSLPAGHNGHQWNMWRGFAVKPAQGDWSRLQDHIFANIAGGRQDRNDWLLNWMALAVQKRGLVIGTAPVLMGLPGTGKGVLANAFGALWKPHFVSITRDDHVHGRFNSHLLGRRFVYIDEAMFGGDRRNAGVIKTMLTEPQIMIEPKGVDPIMLENHMIFMVTSNEKSVVPADIGDRRWQVFLVSDARREDRAYFGELNKQMRSGGYQAMLFDLLNRDISKGPDPRKTIRTPELFDQIIQAAGPVEKYFYQVLDSGRLPQPEAPKNRPGVSTIAAMYADMRRTQPNAQYIHETQFGKDIRKMFKGVRTVTSGCFIATYSGSGDPITRSSTRYHFPLLQDCRKMYEAYIGQTIPWPVDVPDWLGDDDLGYDYSALKAGDNTPF